MWVFGGYDMWLWVCGGSVAMGCGGLVWVGGMWWFVVGYLPAWCGWGVWEKNKENELLNCGK